MTYAACSGTAVTLLGHAEIDSSVSLAPAGPGEQAPSRRSRW
ncbi:hypothetical protein ABZ883_00760 [Streptomyces sp. NPDC046977]